MTGRYQTRFGHEFNPAGGKQGHARGSRRPLANRARALGYATGLVGKWHLGNEDQNASAPSAAFKNSSASSAAPILTSPARAKDILRGTKPVDEKEYLTDALGREAVSFIDKHAKIRSSCISPSMPSTRRCRPPTNT